MEKTAPVNPRIPIWIALSDFYLDTELQDFTYGHIARVIDESPYSLEEVKEIDKTEVFPVLYQNLLNVAGVWGAFQEEWLVARIQEKLPKRNALKRFLYAILYRCMKGMFKDCWEQVELQLQKVNSNTSANSSSNSRSSSNSSSN